MTAIKLSKLSCYWRIWSYQRWLSRLISAIAPVRERIGWCRETCQISDLLDGDFGTRSHPRSFFKLFHSSEMTTPLKTLLINITFLYLGTALLLSLSLIHRVASPELQVLCKPHYRLHSLCRSYSFPAFWRARRALSVMIFSQPCVLYSKQLSNLNQPNLVQIFPISSPAIQYGREKLLVDYTSGLALMPVNQKNENVHHSFDDLARA